MPQTHAPHTHAPRTHAPGADVPLAGGTPSLGQASPETAAELKAATVARLRAAHRTGIRRFRLVTCVLLVMLLALLVASILLGGVKRIPAGDILPAAFGMRTGLADYVIFRIRMPRALAALLAGALFGLSGALYQRLVRNPLATPDMVGISAGAGAGATTMLLFAPAVPFGTSLAGLGGAFVLVATVLALSGRGGGVDTYRLVLVGIGLSAVCTAYVNYLFTVAGQQGIAQVMRWLVGSVNDATWDGVSTLAGALAVCGLCTALLSRSLGNMALGDQLALGLGTRVGVARIATLLVGAAAAALATSVTGPIGFVSLISGPIATRLVGADRSVALAVPIGAVIVLGADVLAQHGPLISPVPTGVLTALLGAPYFVRLILRRRQGATA
ncbi:iron ABC transporter permease [Streptomyces sp. NPDC096097]|uniref:FecCD family ABC transporter permease n=1 Tax=Streptomyces sp. NPDC096097 TaxID=3155546 RepID=UPI003332118F